MITKEEILMQYANEQIKKYRKLMNQETNKSTNYLVYKGQVMAYKHIIETIESMK